MRSTKLNPLTLRITMVLCSLLVTLWLVEVILREVRSHIKNEKVGGIFSLARPDELIDFSPKGKRLRPGLHAIIKNHYISNMDVPIETNSLGFRHADSFKTNEHSKNLKVLVLGDSVTLADHLPVEMTHIYRTQQIVRHNYSNVEIINAGVGDIGIKESVDILEETLAQIRPDYVILSIYLNDSRPSWGFSAESRHRSWLRRHSLLIETILSHAELNRWIRKTGEDRFAWITAKDKIPWKSERSAFNELVEKARWDWGSIWLPEEQEKLLHEVQRAQTVLQDRAALALMILPVTFQVESTFLDDSPQRFLLKEARARNLPILDVLPTLRKFHLEHPQEQLFYDQCHLTATGSEAVANDMAIFIQNLIANNQK